MYLYASTSNTNHKSRTGTGITMLRAVLEPGKEKKLGTVQTLQHFTPVGRVAVACAATHFLNYRDSATADYNTAIQARGYAIGEGFTKIVK